MPLHGSLSGDLFYAVFFFGAAFFFFAAATLTGLAFFALGITEDQFKAMDPAAQQKIEEKIREMIRQQAENRGDTRTGLITDKSV